MGPLYVRQHSIPFLLFVYAVCQLHAEVMAPAKVLDYRQARLTDGDSIRVVDDIKVSDGELVILVRGVGGRSHIAFIKPSTQAFHSIPLGFRPGSNWIALDGDNVLLSRRVRDGKGIVHDTLVTMNRGGAVLETRQLPSAVEVVLAGGNSVMAIQPDGLPVPLQHAPAALTSSPGFGRPAATLSPDSETIIIDCLDGRALITDPLASKWIASWAIPEEIRKEALAKIHSLGGPQALMVNDVATLGNGQVLVNMSVGIKLAEGAKVLRLTRSGQLVDTLRLRLPSRSEYKTAHNPEGLMHPVMIETHDGSLFVADRKGVIAQYILK